MSLLPLSLLLISWESVGAALPTKLQELQQALQAELDILSKAHPDFGLQLGWSSEDGSFALAAGVVPNPQGAKGSTRPMSPFDKLLFGSGTKPITSVAVLHLMEAGVLTLDDPVAVHVDPVLMAANGTTLTALFGEDAKKVTVGHVLHMQSGFADFDTPALDDDILTHADEEWPPYAILHAAGAQQPAMHFAPGTRTEYSSTNYVLAGLVLLAHSPEADNDWRRLDLFTLTFPHELRDQYRNVSFLNDEPISSAVTVPGMSGMIKGQLTPIYAQRGGILGWTCGNMAGSALDAARFYRDLLVTKRLLQPESIDLMQDFHALNYGWARGMIEYGAGLMIQQSTYQNVTLPPRFDEWGSYIGHGGDTYGFLSEQGIVGGLDNASFSVVANEDTEPNFVKGALACRTIVTAARILRGINIGIACQS